MTCLWVAKWPSVGFAVGNAGHGLSANARDWSKGRGGLLSREGQGRTAGRRERVLRQQFRRMLGNPIISTRVATFRCEKWVKIPGKLQLSSARARRLVRPESAAAAPVSSRHHGFKPCRPRLRALGEGGPRTRAVAPRTCAGAINEKVLGPEQSRYGAESQAPWRSLFLSERDPTRARSIQGARAGDLRVSARPRASRYGNGSR
jgi:hypothetical protein